MSKADIHPFPGLRAFHETEGFLFFGRDGQSEAILRAMRRSRLLAVVGTSGSGKSSLIRAGLIPYLHGGFLEPAGSRWRIAVMRPGADPISALAQAIIGQDLLEPKPADPDDARKRIMLTAATLRRGGLGLAETVRLARLPEGDNILIVVDQFEELFRFDEAVKDARAGDEAAAFVKLLVEAARQTQTSIYIVLTMRSDFIGDCSRFRDLPEIVTEGLYLVPRLTRAQRREVIEGPIRVAGSSVTPRLVSRVLNDIGDDPDQLPILQHAMMRTWDHWLAQGDPDQPVDLAGYEAMGGAAQALSHHADEAFNSLDAAGQTIARKLFQCLTEKDADNRESRRPTRLDTIAAAAGATIEEARAVVETFRAPGRSFLMPPPAVPLEPETVIDISHESLIRGWRRLREWVAAEAESVRIYRRLAETAMLHAEGNAGLWRDPDLAVALAWREREHPSAAWGQRYNKSWDETVRFLEASRSARDAAAEAEARALLAEKRRNRSLFGAASFGLLIVAGLAGYVVYETGLAISAQQKMTEALKLTEELQIKANIDAQIAKQKQTEASRLNDISRQAMLFVVRDVINTAAVFSEDGHFDKAIQALKGFDETILNFNQQFRDDHTWIPEVADIKVASALVYINQNTTDLAATEYKAILDLVGPFISSDPSFIGYRLKAMEASRGLAYCYQLKSEIESEISALQSAKAALSGFTPEASDIGKFGLGAGLLNQSLGDALVRANRRAEAQPIFADMINWLARAANAGEKDAATKLGYVYRDGVGVSEDIAQAIKWFTVAADAGSGEAANLIGIIYYKGLNGSRDLIEARKWYRKSAEAGNYDGMSNLAWMLENGSGGDKDEHEAHSWYLKAATAGNISAERSLGEMYEKGRDVPQSDQAAFQWYRKAADRGDSVAEFNMGVMYSAGRGVDKDALESLNWYRKSADAGYSPAGYELGRIYEFGAGGVAKSPAEAAKWYTRAAEAGYLAAEYSIGRLYEVGQGVDKSDAAALKWYRLAADSINRQPPPTFKDKITIAYATGGLGNVLFRQKALAEASTRTVQCLTMITALMQADSTWTPPKDTIDRYANLLGNIAYDLVLARNFADALLDTDLAISFAPTKIFIQGNRAHALMFLDRKDEAREIYLKYRGTPNVIGDKSWEQSVLADFDEFATAGLTNSLIDEIKATFAQKQ